MQRGVAGSPHRSSCYPELLLKQACLHRATPFRSSRRRGLPKLAAPSQEVKTAEKAEAAEAAAAEVEASPENEEEAPRVEAKDEKGETLKNEKGETIYLGFEKGDYAPRDGRKGRTIVDDAERYPSRSELVGGWAGGEVGLQQFVEEAAEVVDTAPSEPKAQQEGAQPAKKGSGSAAEQAQADDPAKYPSKDSIGPFSGVTGGFAGGERGVQQYVDEGDLKLAPPGRGRQFSPLIIAGGVALVASLGGLLLDDGVKLGEEAVEKGGVPGVNLATAPIDDNTKLALQVGVALLGVVGVSVGVRALVKQVQEGTGKLAEKALDLGKIGVFWIGVFVAVKYVLESS